MAIRDVVNILLNKKVSKWFVIAIFFINLLSVFIVYIGLNELYKRDIKETELLCGNLTQALSQNIENIPIPDVNAGMQNSIIQAVEPLINGLPPEEAQIAYEQLDQLIFKLFNLTSKEQDIIKHAVDGENKFLF